MTAFDCKVTGATSTKKIMAPVDPVWCSKDDYASGNCNQPAGAKRPLYAYNSPSNVVWQGNDDRPGYVSRLGAPFCCRNEADPYCRYTARQLGIRQGRSTG